MENNVISLTQHRVDKVKKDELTNVLHQIALQPLSQKAIDGVIRDVFFKPEGSHEIR